MTHGIDRSEVFFFVAHLEKLGGGFQYFLCSSLNLGKMNSF